MFSPTIFRGSVGDMEYEMVVVGGHPLFTLVFWQRFLLKYLLPAWLWMGSLAFNVATGYKILALGIGALAVVFSHYNVGGKRFRRPSMWRMTDLWDVATDEMVMFVAACIWLTSLDEQSKYGLISLFMGGQALFLGRACYKTCIEASADERADLASRYFGTRGEW